MATLAQSIDAALMPEYLKTFLEWSQKKRQEKLAKYEQKKIEEQKIAQSRAARASILATPLRQVSAPQKANQQPFATPSAKPISSRISVVPMVTPSREDLLKKWQDSKQTEGSKTPAAKKAVKIMTPVKGVQMTPSRVKVSTTDVDSRVPENDVDDLEMKELSALIDKRKLESAAIARDGDLEAARQVLLKLEEEDIRAPAHAKWWVARAQLEEFASNYNEVVALFEEAGSVCTKERQLLKDSLRSFMRRRIEEAEEHEEIDGLLPSPSGKSPRTPDEASDAPLVKGLATLSIATQPPAELITVSAPAITITEEKISATPSTPTRSPRRLPAAFMEATNKAIEAAKAAERENSEKVLSESETASVKTENVADALPVTPKKAIGGKALAVFAAAALAEHDLLNDAEETSTNNNLNSASNASNKKYIDDYEDIFAKAKKTLRQFGLYTTYQPVVPSASKRKNAKKSNATPVAMKVNRRLVHRTAHHSPSKIAVVTPVRRSIRLERAAVNALRNVGIHVEKPKKEIVVPKKETDDDDLKEVDELLEEDEEDEEVEDEEETEDVLVYMNPHIKLENEF